MKNIHAFTETTTTPPGYISINDDAGRLTVSVRSRGGQTGGVIEMNRDQLEALVHDVQKYLWAGAIPAAVPVPESTASAPVVESKPEPKIAKDKA